MWAWSPTHSDRPLSEWKAQLTLAASLGITDIALDSNAGNQELTPSHLTFLSSVSSLGASLGLRVHMWYLTLLCNLPSLLEAPDADQMYATSRSGSSCLTSPPHAEWCHFLCPSSPSTLAHTTHVATTLASLPHAAGVSLDYIRTPSNRCQGDPDTEYCFCPSCGGAEGAGSAVVDLVDAIAQAVKGANPRAVFSAAVYPMLDHAKAAVNQHWDAFNVDALLLMAYPTYHGQNYPWIHDVGIDALTHAPPGCDLYLGLLLHPLLPLPDPQDDQPQDDDQPEDDQPQDDQPEDHETSPSLDTILTSYIPDPILPAFFTLDDFLALSSS